MPKYGGGHEDLAAEQAAVDALGASVDKLTAKEKVRAKETGTANAEEQRGVNIRERRIQQQREAREVNERLAEVEGVEAPRIDKTTEATLRATRATEALTRARINAERAFAGARDPLFARATALGKEGLPPSQPQLRSALGIGSGRAARLQEAIKSGQYTPAAPTAQPYGPLAPQQAIIQADIDRAQAARRYSRSLDKGDFAAAEAAAAAKQEAIARKTAAEEQLKSVRSVEAVQVTAKELAAAQEKAAVQILEKTGAAPGAALVPRTPAAGAIGGRMYGESGPFYGAFPPPGPRNYPIQRGATRPIFGFGGPGDENPGSWMGLRGGRTTISPQQVAQTRRYTESLLESRPAIIRMAEAEDRLSGSVRRSAVEMETASQSNLKHGALSSEYIMAAARGETTLRELGNQALITGGKFGAWTAAASVIYGVAAALHEVAKGAIESQSGLGQLHRFIPGANQDQAQQGYRDLARYANVPIHDAADAQAQFARIYHDQGDALEAARASLLATKLDNISTGDSYQYLTAGALGFGLQAKDLMGVIAQLNALHNKMGARVSETVPAFGRAAAAVKNAGGSYNQFLAIIATMQRASGLTGLSVATILSRSATRFVPKNRADLQKFGLDPNEGYTQLIVDAVQKARQLGPENRRKLAEALGGPQLGSRGFVGLLSRPDLLNQSLGVLGDPQGNRRLLERERTGILGTPAEQIHQIPVNLERLGSALGETGAGAPALLFLHTLNGILNLATHLVEIFDLIPNPLRSGLAIMLEITAAMRLMQRFGASVPLLNRLTPERRESGFILRGSRASVKAATDERERVTTQYNRAAESAARTRIQVGELEQGAARHPAGSAERAAYEDRLAVAQRTLATQTERALELELESNAARARVLEELEVQAALERAKRESGAAGVRAYAVREGLYRPQEAGQPTARGAVRAGAPLPGEELPQREAIGAHTGLPMIIPAGVTDAEAGALVKAETATATRTERTARQLERLGVSGGILAGATRKAGGIVSGTGGRLSNLGQGVRALGSEMASMIGPLDALIAGFLIFEGARHAVQSAQEQGTAAIARLQASSPVDNPANVAAVQNQISGGFHPLRGAQNLVASGVNAYTGFFASLSGHTGTQLATQNQVAREFAKAGQSEIDTINQIQRTRGEMYRADQIDRALRAKLAEISAQRPPTQGLVALTGTPDLLGNLSQLPGVGDTPSLIPLNRLPRQGSQQAQTIAAYRASIQQTKDSIREYKSRGDAPKTVAALEAELGQLQNQLQQVQAGHGDKRTLQWAALMQSPKLFQARVKQDSDAIRAYFNEFGKLRGSYGLPDLKAAYAVAKSTAREHPTAGNLANLAAISGTLQGIGQDILTRYQDDLGAARNAHDRAKAFEDAMAKLRQLPRGRERRQAVRQLDQSSYQADQTARQADAQYRESATDDPAKKAAIAIHTAAKGVREAARKFGVGSDQWKAAMTDWNAAQSQADEAAIGRVAANNQVREARVALATGSDPVAGARAALQSARATYAAVKAHSDDPTKIAAAYAGVITAEVGVAQSAQDQARELAQIRTQTAAARAGGSPEAQARAAQDFAAWERAHARNKKERAQAILDTYLANNQAEQVAVEAEQSRYELLASMTDDPVKQAEYKIKGDRVALRHAHGKTAKNRARTQLNDDIKARRDVILQGQEGDIDFNLEMDRITRQQAITQYQQLLRSHNLTKQQRREILQKIHSLQKESEQEASGFGLQVGQGVKVPTIYDIRRAISGTRRATEQGTAYHAKTDVTVNVEVNDPDAAGAVFDAIDGALQTGVKATVRNAGMSLR